MQTGKLLRWEITLPWQFGLRLKVVGRLFSPYSTKYLRPVWQS